MPEQLAEGVRLLDDGRTIRTRWAEVYPGEPWTADEWSESSGAVLTLARSGEAEGAMAVSSIEVRDGVGFVCE